MSSVQAKTGQPSIGNDLVDLRVDDPPLHDRYHERAFTDLERVNFGSNAQLMWEHWAAKEAAYKALRRHSPSLSFTPKRFEYDAATQSIRYLQSTIPCKKIITDEYVFVSCTINAREADSPKEEHWVEQLYALSSTAFPAKFYPYLPFHSRAVRFLAAERISSLLNIRRDEVVITEKNVTNGSGLIMTVPSLKQKGSTKLSPLSYTHDGRFIACSVLIT